MHGFLRGLAASLSSFPLPFLELTVALPGEVAGTPLLGTSSAPPFRAGRPFYSDRRTQRAFDMPDDSPTPQIPCSKGAHAPSHQLRILVILLVAHPIVRPMHLTRA